MLIEKNAGPFLDIITFDIYSTICCLFKLVRICEATGDKEKLERYMDTFRQAAKHLVFQIQSIVIWIQCIVIRIQLIVIRIQRIVIRI